MAEINGEEKRIVVSGEQIEEAVGKVPTIEADVKENKQSISALQTTSAQHTADIAKNTADIEKKANADEVYSREETDSAITAKVAEIVAGAPEEFDTLKEMSDWLTEHSDSAATMNTAIQANTKAIADNTADIEANTAEIESNKSDILSLGENKLNFAYFVAQNTTTTAGWFEVAKCDVVPSGGGNVRDITLCIQLTNANSTVGAKWAILNVATVISGNSAGSTIDTMVVKFIVNNGFNASEENPDIVVVGTTEGKTVKLAIWCKLQVQYAYCRGIPLIDAARISIKQFNTPNYWQMLNTTAKYDSYPTDWERKIIPTDYYGGQLKSLSDRIKALENK